MIFPTQAINELVAEFKLLRKDIQAIRTSLERIERQQTPKPSLNQPLTKTYDQK